MQAIHQRTALPLMSARAKLLVTTECSSVQSAARRVVRARRMMMMEPALAVQPQPLSRRRIVESPWAPRLLDTDSSFSVADFRRQSSCVNIYKVPMYRITTGDGHSSFGQGMIRISHRPRCRKQTQWTYRQ